jgi:coenzyme F420-reducing hydrogenase alpha subunit
VSDRTIEVDYLARVEGEGALTVRLKDGRVDDVQLRIFEPPRFFEAFLRGRSYEEAPDITARICGICPVAYQMSACHAMEKALGITVGGQLRELRRLLYCGEWIESHTLHIYLLHAPDFLGYPDAFAMAKDYRAVVEQGLRLKRAGNALMELLGGREIHPINVRVGGFYRCPTAEEFAGLRPQLEEALGLAEATARFVAGFDFPEVEEPYEFVSLRGPNEYPMNEGEVVSSEGLRIPAEEFDQAFEEVQVPYSNAYQVVRRGGGSFLTGPMARYALNRDRLSPRAAAIARELQLGEEVRNPFRSILVRAVEVVYACEESLRIIDQYRPPDVASVVGTRAPSAGTCAAVTEAPRGMLFHRYDLDDRGKIVQARIIAPTTQNQKRIEDDVRHVVERSLTLDDARLADLCERSIRNHDPCISCATHFLRLEVQRG